MIRQHIYPMKTSDRFGFIIGVFVTFVIAIAAKALTSLPLLAIMGQLVIAIVIGMVVRAVVTLPGSMMDGVQFANKKLLRIGIILLGMRLDLSDIVRAGPKLFLLAAINIGFALAVVYGLTRIFGVDRRLGLLTACGTAICGAAAVVAVSPQVKASDEETAVGAATVAILGTIFTLIYTLLYPVIGFSDHVYGIFAGATLHEIAHVLAAAAPGGEQAVDIAVIVKLTRVAMLVPVAVVIGIWSNRIAAKRGVSSVKDGNTTKSSWKSLPIPWFIFGFVAMSGIHTLGIVTNEAAGGFVTAAYMLIAMAMAGLGLNVDARSFRRMGFKPFMAGLIGSILLSLFAFAMMAWLKLI